MDTKDKKRILNSLNMLDIKIFECTNELEELRSKSTSVSVTQNEKLTSNINYDKMLKIYVMIEELENTILLTQKEYNTLYFKISAAIEDLENVQEQIIIRKRYLLLKKWEDIADDMCFSVAHVHRLHNKALLHLELLDDN